MDEWRYNLFEEQVRGGSDAVQGQRPASSRAYEVLKSRVGSNWSFVVIRMENDAIVREIEEGRCNLADSDPSLQSELWWAERLPSDFLCQETGSCTLLLPVCLQVSWGWPRLGSCLRPCICLRLVLRSSLCFLPEWDSGWKASSSFENSRCARVFSG